MTLAWLAPRSTYPLRTKANGNCTMVVAPGLEVDSFENVFDMALEIFDGAVVEDEIVSHGDGAAFFHFFDFAVVALADGLSVKGAVGALRDAFITHSFRDNNGEESEAARKFVLEGAIFGPGVESIKNDVFLTSFNQVFGFSDSLASDPIFALGFADHLAKGLFAFTVNGAFNPALSHLLVNHVTEVNFGITEFIKIFDGYGFATAAHANNGENFNVLCFHIR